MNKNKLDDYFFLMKIRINELLKDKNKRKLPWDSVHTEMASQLLVSVNDSSHVVSWGNSRNPKIRSELMNWFMFKLFSLQPSF